MHASHTKTRSNTISRQQSIYSKSLLYTIINSYAPSPIYTKADIRIGPLVRAGSARSRYKIATNRARRFRRNVATLLSFLAALPQETTDAASRLHSHPPTVPAALYNPHSHRARAASAALSIRHIATYGLREHPTSACKLLGYTIAIGCD